MGKSVANCDGWCWNIFKKACTKKIKANRVNFSAFQHCQNIASVPGHCIQLNLILPLPFQYSASLKIH